MRLDQDEIVELMEELKKEEVIRFTIPEIFGGGVAVIGLNPNPPGKEQKKFILRVGQDEASALGGNIYWQKDKAKHIAKWVADRQGDQME
jgi:hypothetical protein